MSFTYSFDISQAVLHGDAGIFLVYGHMQRGAGQRKRLPDGDLKRPAAICIHQ